MLLEALILSLIIGYLRGGHLERLALLDFKLPYLVIIAFLIQLLIPWLAKIPQVSGSYIFYVLIFTYVLLLAAAAFNLRNQYFQIIGLGIFFNFLVIVLNGGMPVLPKVKSFTQYLGVVFGSAAGAEAKSLGDFIHISMSSATKLKFLADILPFPTLYPRLGWAVYSVGDLLVSIGVFLLIQRVMVYKGKRVKKKKKRKSIIIV